MTLALVPFAADVPTSLTVARHALAQRLAPGEELDDLFGPIESGIRSARAIGGLLRSEGTAEGIALWEPFGPLGAAVRLLYLEPAHANMARYSEALDTTLRAAGPIAFLPGPLAGLSRDEEYALLEERGFAPFGRSEMVLPPEVELLPPVPPDGTLLRSVQPSDQASLARLHESAYADHLDRFLALEELDPRRDAEREVREYFDGRWGELLVPGSTVVVHDGRPVSAVIAVKRAAHALLIDVMTDPVFQGRGFGRLALVSAAIALRGRGENAIALNVTEGNDRALQLYANVGFVRTVGPSVEWYDARRMPVRFPVPRRR